MVNKDASSAYTMTNRGSVGAFDEDLAKTPGPGHYNMTQPDNTALGDPCTPYRVAVHVTFSGEGAPGPGLD